VSAQYILRFIDTGRGVRRPPLIGMDFFTSLHGRTARLHTIRKAGGQGALPIVSAGIYRVSVIHVRWSADATRLRRVRAGSRCNGIHFKGTTASGVFLPDTTQPAFVRWHGFRRT
jgi:hypothetical protein